MKKRIYKITEINFLKQAYNQMPFSSICARLNITKNALYALLKRYGLKRTKEEIAKFRDVCNAWTQKEDNVIRQNYETKKLSEITEMLPNRTLNSVEARIRKLGLYKTKEQIKSILKRKKVHKKINRPKKVVRSFQKSDLRNLGQIKSFGKTKIVKIRTMHGWENYARFLWALEYGEIPKKHFVCFKDGNSENVTLENLELRNIIEKRKLSHDKILASAKQTFKARKKSKEFRNKLQGL